MGNCKYEIMFWLPCQKRLKIIMFCGRREINAYHNVHTELFIIRKYVQTDRDIRNANESVVRLNFSFRKLTIQLL